MTIRCYWDDDHPEACDAIVTAVSEQAVSTDRTVFHPGGGGQPCDLGWLDGRPVIEVRAVPDGAVWHRLDGGAPPVGSVVLLRIDAERRRAVARHHTVLHVLNALVLQNLGGFMTGTRIDVDGARIDFQVKRFDPGLRTVLEREVNTILRRDAPIRAGFVSEAEYRLRPELRRTLVGEPPVIDGMVRVVEIEGFDAQACGGTHVASTAEVGRFSIVRTDNKGANNKRLYVRLDP